MSSLAAVLDLLGGDNFNFDTIWYQEKSYLKYSTIVLSKTKFLLMIFSFPFPS